MTTTMTRRGFGAAAVGLAAGAAGAGGLTRPAAAQQRGGQQYPTRPVTILVGYSAGGSTDFVARLLAQHLAADLGQQFVIDNRAGAVGTIAATAAARARPDGYTLLAQPNTNYAMVPYMMRLQYDHEKAFAPIGLLATNAQFMCVHPSVRAQTAAEFIALAKAEPGKLTYSSSGAGSSAHLAAELFLVMAGIDVTHVPYRGGAPAAQALLGNEVQMSMVDAVTALPYIRNRDVRALAVTSAEPIPQAPEVPTVTASGLPGYQSSTDFALFAPAGTPEPIIRRLSEATVKAMRSPEVKTRMEPLAIEPVGGTPEEFTAYLERESSKWREVIRTRNIRID
jgi:tripartite-type tricarboxylate transporter receptor subunit TctC